VNENPTKQDFNGLAFTLGQLLAYLHQRGVPEWNAAQEYYEGSVVTTLAGIYRLKSGGVGSSDPDTDGGFNWELIPTQAKVDDKANISGQIFTGEINYRGAGGVTTNTGYGENVLQNNTEGKSNTANGRDALYNNTIGNNNTAYGYGSGYGIETGSGNSIFGANVTGLAPDLTDNLILASGGVIRLQHDGVGTTTVQGDLVADNLSGTNTGDQTLSEIGVGQTWMAVTDSRSSGVTYTNSTGKPIAVSVQGNSRVVSMTVGGVSTTVYLPGTDYAMVIVPNGQTYTATITDDALLYWAELR